MTTLEKIKVMQAYEEGKQIQYKRNKERVWHYCFNPVWDWSSNIYRIEPEEKNQTYRPYKDTKEMIADYKERFNVNVMSHVMPFVWIKDKSNGDIKFIEGYSQNLVYVFSGWWSLKVIYEGFTYLDGSPIGKLVEE